MIVKLRFETTLTNLYQQFASISRVLPGIPGMPALIFHRIAGREVGNWETAHSRPGWRRFRVSLGAEITPPESAHSEARRHCRFEPEHPLHAASGPLSGACNEYCNTQASKNPMENPWRKRVGLSSVLRVELDSPAMVDQHRSRCGALSVDLGPKSTCLRSKTAHGAP